MRATRLTACSSAWLRHVAGGGIDIIVSREDGGGVRRLNAAPLTDLTDAYYTPDSRYILVRHPFAGFQRVELLDVTGTEAPRELAAGYNPDNVSFRPPDSGEILFRGLVEGHYAHLRHERGWVEHPADHCDR